MKDWWTPEYFRHWQGWEFRIRAVTAARAIEGPGWRAILERPKDGYAEREPLAAGQMVCVLGQHRVIAWVGESVCEFALDAVPTIEPCRLFPDMLRTDLFIRFENEP